MFKKFGILGLILAAATVFQPKAFGDDWHRHHDDRQQYNGDRHDRRDRDDRRREERGWRDNRRQEHREHEWRERERRQNRYNNYYGNRGYYSVPRYYAPGAGVYFSWGN